MAVNFINNLRKIVSRYQDCVCEDCGDELNEAVNAETLDAHLVRHMYDMELHSKDYPEKDRSRWVTAYNKAIKDRGKHFQEVLLPAQKALEACKNACGK